MPANADLAELLPYILEGHGPGTRLSVMRDASTARARSAKRAAGVFYTPADVADFMVARALDELGAQRFPLTILDPACGTGVFLLAALRALRGRGRDDLDIATLCLFGIDLSGRAVQGAVFALLAACMGAVQRRGLSPFAAWHAIRLNFDVRDALTLVPGKGPDHPARAARRAELRRQILGACPPAVLQPAEAPQAPSTWDAAFRATRWVEVGSLFPEAADGFSLLVGNPPYADLGRRPDRSALASEYQSIRGVGETGSEEIYTFFVEHTWRLTRSGESAAALVLPLSIAFHTSEQFRGLRRAMATAGGRWSCAYFDRQPHALFGEDVKTRNAIILRREGPSDPARGDTARWRTGPLQKWTSRTRAQMFASISFYDVGQIAVESGLPKISGPLQAAAYTALAAAPGKLRASTVRIDSCLPTQATSAGLHEVFVAGTAYNYLGVCRSLEAEPPGRGEMSDSKLHRLRFRDGMQAHAAFAVLSSRLVYWLWLAVGDGFHVSRGFVERVPFDPAGLPDEELLALAALGERLWREVQGSRVVSVNRGRYTVSYRPHAAGDTRDEIDRVLLRAGRLPESFLDELRLIEKTTVVVDPEDDRRKHLHSYFASEEPTE